MNEIPPPKGTLFISKSVFQFDKWLTDQAIAAAELQMRKYDLLDGFLQPSPVRHGDFSFIQAVHKIDPVIASFIGIPGRQKPPIIQELFVSA